MKSLKNFSSNALVAPNKVMGGAPNVGQGNEAPTLADLYPTGITVGPKSDYSTHIGADDCDL